jgi:phage terminase large subunit
MARALLLKGIESPVRILCARETMKSLQDSCHKILSDLIKEYQMEGPYEVQESKILGSNGTEIFFAGLLHNVRNIKSAEAVDIAWVEEAQSVSEDSWETLIPTIRRPNSEIWVSFNPGLSSDPTYKRFVLDPPSTARVVKINWNDNPWFPEVLRIEMEELKRKNYPRYLHIWEGECASVVEGAIYGAELQEAQDEGRICQVSLDRTRAVDTFWDLGYGDYTAILFTQSLPGGTHHVIDYLENAGKTIQWYLMELQKRGYLYGTDWLPHDGVDAMIHTRLAGGDKTRSIEMIMRNSGRKVRISPKLGVTSGINAVRSVFPNLRIDETKCARFLDCLRNYQWGETNEYGVTKRVPLHNWASHGADSARTFATSVRTPAIIRDEPDIPRRALVADAWMA